MDVKKVKAYNIFILGIVFMLIFTGFNTMTGIQVSTVSPGGSKAVFKRQ